jgi:hypothetical protein
VTLYIKDIFILGFSAFGFKPTTDSNKCPLNCPLIAASDADKFRFHWTGQNRAVGEHIQNNLTMQRHKSHLMKDTSIL